MSGANQEKKTNQKAGQEKKTATSIGSVAKLYLLAYNTIQVVGWSHVMFETLKFYVNGQQGSLYEAVNPSLLIFQSAAALEVLNVAVGLVRSGLVTTAFQVASRLMVIWLVLYSLPPSRESIGLPLLLFAWCITEIIRYSYYALGLLNIIPYALTWCRYTFFFALYPIGVAGEISTIVASLPYVRKEKPMSFELPNPLNFTFCLEYFFYFILVLYVLIFPSLYKHMISQRKKVLGSGTSASTAKKPK